MNVQIHLQMKEKMEHYRLKLLITMKDFHEHGIRTNLDMGLIVCNHFLAICTLFK